jgi:hypothetical protein
MANLNLWSDAWIPVAMVEGGLSAVSMADAVSRQDIADVVLPPVARMAVLRLLVAAYSSPPEDDDGFWLYGEPGFLQCLGLPHSPRPAHDILNMVDSANAALSPSTDPQPCDDATIAVALVTAFFCDRPGLKTRGPGLPVSGSRPLCMGQIVAMPWHGDTLHDLLDMNAVVSDWVPWWERPVVYDEPDTGDLLQAILWPWRRLAASPQGIVVAGGRSAPQQEDLWATGRASLRHLNGLGDDAPAFPADITVTILSQATPLACWNQRTKPTEA